MQRLMQLCLRHVTSDRSVEFKRIDKNFKQLRKEVRRVLSSFSGQSAGMIHKANVASQPALGTCHASILVLSQEELNEKSTLQSKRDMSSTFPLKQTTNRDRREKKIAGPSPTCDRELQLSVDKVASIALKASGSGTGSQQLSPAAGRTKDMQVAPFLGVAPIFWWFQKDHVEGTPPISGPPKRTGPGRSQKNRDTALKWETAEDRFGEKEPLLVISSGSADEEEEGCQIQRRKRSERDAKAGWSSVSASHSLWKA